MEGLKLEDLSFDVASDEIFNVFEADKGTNKEVEIKKPEEKKETTLNSENNSSESVAVKEENKTNNQDGNASQGNDGNSNSSSPKPNDTEKLYSSLANEFKAKGVLPNLDIEKVKSLDDIYKAVETEVESRLTNKQKMIDEAIKVGVPANEVAKQIDSIEKLKAIPDEHITKEDNFEFRKNVIAQDFINKGFAREKAIAMAQRSIDSGDDIDDAQLAMKEIIAHEESILNNSIQSKKEEESNALTQIRSYVDKEDEIIPGIKLTTAQKQELYNNITSDLGNKENAFIKAQKEDPLGSRMKLEALFYLTKGLKDFSVFSNRAETKVTNEIESLLRGVKFTEEGRVNTDIKDSMSTFTLKDLEGVTFE